MHDLLFLAGVCLLGLFLFMTFALMACSPRLFMRYWNWIGGGGRGDYNPFQVSYVERRSNRVQMRIAGTIGAVASLVNFVIRPAGRLIDLIEGRGGQIVRPVVPPSSAPHSQAGPVVFGIVFLIIGSVFLFAPSKAIRWSGWDEWFNPDALANPSAIRRFRLLGAAFAFVALLGLGKVLLGLWG